LLWRRKAIAFRYQKLAIGMEELEKFHQKKMPDPGKRERSWENITQRRGIRYFPESIKRFDKPLGDMETAQSASTHPTFYVPGLAYWRQDWKNLLRMIKRTEETYSMEITERRTADIVTLGLSGRLDANTAKAFEEKILGQIESGDRRFIIDLAQLDYIGSAGLRVFLLAAKRLDSANGKLVLCGFKKTIPYYTLNRPKDPVREAFDIVGFSSIFSTYGSDDDAIKSLQA
jgi:anti-anti-sigma factor